MTFVSGEQRGFFFNHATAMIFYQDYKLQFTTRFTLYQTWRQSSKHQNKPDIHTLTDQSWLLMASPYPGVSTTVRRSFTPLSSISTVEASICTVRSIFSTIIMNKQNHPQWLSDIFIPFKSSPDWREWSIDRWTIKKLTFKNETNLEFNKIRKIKIKHGKLHVSIN